VYNADWIAVEKIKLEVKEKENVEIKLEAKEKEIEDHQTENSLSFQGVELTSYQ